MPVDIEALRADPAFRALPQAAQEDQLRLALRRNASERPVVGTQRLLGQDVPIQQPGTLEEQRAPRLVPEASAAPPTTELDTLGSTVGGLTGQLVGTAVGGMTAPVTGPVGPAVGRVTGGALGSAGGLAVARKLRTGDWPSAGELALDAGLSALPESVESLLRGVGRTMARSTKAAQVIRFDEAARQARQLPEQIFQPLPLDQLSGMFDQVRQSGVRVGVGDLSTYLHALTPGKYAELLQEVAQVDRLHKTGGRFTSLIEGVYGQPGQGRVVGLDIGQAQQLSSALRQRLEQLEPFEARQLLRDFRGAMDTDIFSGVAVGRVPAGQTPQVLQTARREYARSRAAETLSEMVENKVTSTSDLQMASFNLRGFFDELRRGTSAISQDVNRALDLTPGARQRFLDSVDNISQLYNTIEVSLADVSGFRRNWVVAGFGQMLSMAMLTESGRALFRQAVLEGRGTLSVNALALAATAARHELLQAPHAARQP